MANSREGTKSTVTSPRERGGAPSPSFDKGGAEKFLQMPKDSRRVYLRDDPCYAKRMHVQLDSPELERFINQEVKSGRFPSHTAAVAAAVERMMLENEFLDTDNETLAAIEDAEVQLDRGEGIPLEKAFADLRKKYVK